MAKKTLHFSINQLVLDNTEFNIHSFSLIENEYFEPQKVTEEEEVEVIAIQKIYKKIIDSRFVTFYFNDGDKFPYSEKVLNASDPTYPEEDNPRSPDQIELNNQFFVLADIAKQRLYISDQRKRNKFSQWLAEKTGKEINIKSIINESEFIEKIKTVDQITFSIEPNLLNSGSEDILSNNLVRDIYGYGADRAKIELSYNHT